MSSTEPCEVCGTRLGHARDCKTFDLPTRLVRKYGRDVPEGDGWSWDWQSDELAVEAAKEIKRLWAECSTCTKCGNHQPEPNWCLECGARTVLPEWATLMVAAVEAQAGMEEYLLEIRAKQIEFLDLVIAGRQDYADHALPGENEAVLKAEVETLKTMRRLIASEVSLADIVGSLVPSWRWSQFRHLDADPTPRGPDA